MKLHLTLIISEQTAKNVSSNAIERVINQTLEILGTSRHGYAPVNETDWLESKATVVDLWVRLQDAIFRHQNNLPEQS